jgi:hypothetical protein
MAIANRKALTKGVATKTGVRFSWTVEEKERLARDSLRLMAQDGTLSRVDALRKAVKGFPKSRQKTIADLNHNSWIFPLWTRLAEEKDALNAAAEPVAPPEVLATPAEPVSAAAEGVNIDSAHAQADAAEAPADASDAQKAAMARARAKAAEMRASGQLKIVYWKADERRTVAKAFVKLRNVATDEEKAKYGFETLTLRRAIGDVLPDNRQRKVVSMIKEREWLSPLILEVEAEIRAEAEEQERLERENGEEAQRLAAQAAAEEDQRKHAARLDQERRDREIEARHEIEERVRAEAVDSFVAHSSLDDLLGLMARKLARALLPAFLDEAKTLMQGSLADLTKMRNEAAHGNSVAWAYRVKLEDLPGKPKKPRVFVYGLLPQQINDVTAEFGEKLDLSFAKQGEGGSTGERKAANADIAIICSDFVSHAGSANIRAAAKHFEFVPGSVSGVKRWLQQWIEKRTAETPAQVQ